MTRTARIALLQLPAYGIEDARASLEHTLRRIDEAAAAKPDLIALPEMTYPAYFIGPGALDRLDVPAAEAIDRIAERARAHRVHIAAGVALPVDGDGVANGAVLVARDGSIAGTYAKSFLWHFDERWFVGGEAYPVFETDFGRLGMLVCADGRLPEIARSLALGGAQLIVDLTAWVSGGRRAADLTTVQREYLMPVRAAENRVWIACADKFGIEGESIVYCGRSCVIDPRGRIVAELGPDEDSTLTYDVPIEDARMPIVRRPELYGALTEPTERLPVLATLNEKVALPSTERRIAVVQMTMPRDGDAFPGLARTHAERLELHDADLVLFPATPGSYRRDYDHARTLDAMLRISSDTGMMLAFTVNEGAEGSGCRAMYLVGRDGVIITHRQSHKPPGEKFATMPMGDGLSPVVETNIGRVALLCGAEAFVPEVPRALMLRGAEILLWSTDDPAISMAPVARCRADENRVFVACAGAPTATGAAMVVDPTGRVLAQALEGRELSVSAAVNAPLSHLKAMAPGTDVVRNRRPATYDLLIRPANTAGNA